MWHLFAKPKKLVTILLSDDRLSMSMFAFERSAYQKVCETKSLAHSEWHQGIIFNISALKKYIASFLAQHAKTSCYVALGIEGSAVHEDIITLERASLPSFDGTSHVPPKLVWNAMVAPSQLADHAQVYLFGMKREHVMQYQLLALQTPFSCCLISSINGAINALHGDEHHEWPNTLASLKAYRAQALEMFLTHHKDVHLLAHEKKEINAGHVGLFLLGKHIYENSQ